MARKCDIKKLAHTCVREFISVAGGLASCDGEIPQGDWDALTKLLGRRPSEEERAVFARSWRATGEWYACECEHESVTTPDGHGAYCKYCGETLA